ncbi:GGDEF domain-containing protein [Caenimonas aquaedulcis]|uniref:GGDEF domain-containing protein n=1 Tax=Caenimonas aquaedulcis TaxID=2793270 RepID=A0A931H1G2_9BURK|nr:GGDEF domain-containing protein [Caenimonas aquaedulcis]MBG9386798.1 GGDEF domain-containing protein [Caenimonas aquaedulcis]
MNATQAPIAALLAVVLLVAVRFVLLRIAQAGRMDAGLSLYTQAGFDARGDALLERCQDGGRPLTVVVFDFADLLEVRAIYGQELARKLTRFVVGQLGIVAGHRGFAARTGPAEFTVVLPRMGRDKAVARIRRVLGSPMRVEFDAGGSEIVMVPEFQLETADACTMSVGELQRELRTELAALHAREERRHRQMQRERERHSRPMALAGLPAAQAA